MNALTKLENELKEKIELCQSIKDSVLLSLWKGSLDKQIMNDSKQRLKGIQEAKKIILDEIDWMINNIATNPKELALAGHKRACCMMTLKELKEKFL